MVVRAAVLAAVAAAATLLLAGDIALDPAPRGFTPHAARSLLDIDIATAATPSATPPQREAAPPPRGTMPRPADAAQQRVATIAQELALSPAAGESVATVVREHAARRAALVAQWQADSGQDGADDSLRAGLDALATWRRQALDDSLGPALAAVLVQRLDDAATRNPARTRPTAGHLAGR